MHAIKDRPMAVDGKVEILPMMYLALSYDHRLIDGRESVGFWLPLKSCWKIQRVCCWTFSNYLASPAL